MTYSKQTRRAVLGAAGILSLAGLVCTPAAAAPGEAKGKTVEYITFGLQFEYQVAMVNGIKAKASAAGVKLDVLDGKGDPNQQVNEVLDAVTKKPDAILINPVDAKLLVAGVKRANEAKIPVFIMENAPPEGKYESFVDFDNEAGGAMGADALAKAIGGKGTVLETRGSTGSSAAELRHKGFTERMKSAYPDITVKSLNTEWVADTAYKMVLDAFTQAPDTKGVFSHNDEMLRGVASALRQIGKLKPAGEDGHVAMVGLDGTPLALKRIRDGVQDATVQQSPYVMGGDIFGAIVTSFEGGHVPETMRTEPTLITKANVNDPENWGNATAYMGARRSSRLSPERYHDRHHHILRMPP